MKILDRWRVAKMRRELAVLLSEDSKERAGETTADLMNRMCARAEQIALLRFNIRRIEGDDVVFTWSPPNDDWQGKYLYREDLPGTNTTFQTLFEPTVTVARVWAATLFT